MVTAFAVLSLAVVDSGCGGGPSGPPALPSLRSVLHPAPSIAGQPPVRAPISAPGGPYLYDPEGRVVFLRGVNVVYKRPPYEVYPDPGKGWNFDAHDASLMARLGVTMVRLGVTWSGLEPGTAPANDPAICTPGKPHDPGQFDQSVVDAYLGKLAKTVAILGRYHIYSMIDMHQDVYNEAFDGEGAPKWAVCTNGVASVDPPGRWSLEYGTRAAGIAFNHFWANDVVGDLQGEYDRAWAAVAGAFRDNPWVVGYDPFNEPFSTSLVKVGDEHFDNQLECFYAGKASVEAPGRGAPPIACPPEDPAAGVIPTILAADPAHLVFYEPDIYARHGFPNFVGPMAFPNLVFNVHVYCGYRSPITGNPTNLSACAAQEARALTARKEDRPELASKVQPGGPAWFVSEFGASSSPAVLGSFTREANDALVGWSYWAWKHYKDPTGSADESLVMSDGRLRSTARVLAETYPEAIAGTPVSMAFDRTINTFSLTYTPDRRVSAPTVVFVPTAILYPDGYCARVTGAKVTSRPGSELLELSNSPAAPSVHLVVSAGRCPA